ncbi:MAG: hypothetical protein D3905_02890 [Candidatus Electrothrix sp. AS4_5]|nr:hypothetical protein [Candidatus Electrothrix gigas]MCI5188746.1 hypothetical protein [Candidatus Electrothrix gigas]
MKKVLVAGAALMLAGSTVPVAFAGNSGSDSGNTTGVSISGDATLYYAGGIDYPYDPVNRINGYSDFFATRVGLNFDAVALGGASIHARLYFDDQGFNDDPIWDKSGDNQLGVSTDYAYMQVPLSKNFTIKAGRLPLSFSPFYAGEIRPTRIQLIYKSGNLKLVPWLGVVSEDEIDLDNLDDNDFMQYGIIPVITFDNDWTAKGFFRYNDDARTVAQDRSGFEGSVNVSGMAGNVALTAEVSYKAADVQGTDDDGTGGYVQASLNMPGFTPTVLAGMTQNGFMAWRDFGFVMMGGNETTTVVPRVGNPIGDLMFGALVFKHDISDCFSAQGNLVYASYDYDNDTVAQGELDSAVEVSGIFNYALSDSTSFEYKLGYLAPTYNDGAPDVLEDAYIGHVLRMNVEF